VIRTPIFELDLALLNPCFLDLEFGECRFYSEQQQSRANDGEHCCRGRQPPQLLLQLRIMLQSSPSNKALLVRTPPVV
jgi:hypothetical protein